MAKRFRKKGRPIHFCPNEVAEKFGMNNYLILKNWPKYVNNRLKAKIYQFDTLQTAKM
jgi:hypothetical protein